MCFDTLHAGHQHYFRPDQKSAGPKRVAKVGEDNICTSIIVAAELRLKCAKSGSERLFKAVEACSERSSCRRWTCRPDTRIRRRRGTETAGKPIGSNDLLIAAHAFATGATMVTANAGEFKRIRGLKVENWLARGSRPTGAPGRSNCRPPNS